MEKFLREKEGIKPYDVEQAYFAVKGEYPDQDSTDTIHKYLFAIESSRQGDPIIQGQRGYDELVALIAIVILNEEKRDKDNGV